MIHPSTRLHRLARRWAAFALTLTALLLVVIPARAHGYLIRILPADGAVLERAPSRLQAWFSEGLEPRFSQMILTDAAGVAIPLTDNGVVPTNTRQLSARIPNALPDGLYILTMRVAFASDGHIYTERYRFWVGQPSGDVATGGASRTADPFEIFWRMLTLPAMNVLFGVAIVYGVVLVPGWGNPHYRAGKLPPRVMARLYLIAWIAVITAFAGTVLAVLQQTAALYDADVGRVLAESLWQNVINGTQIGDTLRARFIFLVAAGVVLYVGGGARERYPDFVAPLWTITAIIASAALLTISVSSHAAGSDLWALGSTFVHWFHVVANAAWIGGLAGMAFVLPVALSGLEEGNRQAALTAVLRRFSVLGAVALALTVATGVYNSALQIRQPSDLTGTAYGAALLAKYALMLPLFGLAAYHHLLVGQDRFTVNLRRRWAERRTLRPALRTGKRTLRAEVALGTGVLICAAVLAANPPPVPPTAGQGVPPPTQTAQVGDLRVTLSLDPAGAGANTYEISLRRGAEAVNDAKITLRAALPALDKRAVPAQIDSVGDGLYIGAGGEFEREGLWWAMLDIQLPDEDAARHVAFAWEIPAIAIDPNARVAGVQNWFGVGLVGLAFGGWIIPPVARRVRRAEFTPEIAFVFIGLSVITVIFFIGGAFALSEAARQTDLLRNPRPAIINPTLPDAESVARGARIYADQCAACHGPGGLGDGPRASAFRRVPNLPFTAPTRRDEALYKAIMEGIGQMPAAPITAAEAWDVINYLRTLPPPTQ